jgi:lipopolysaccharide export system permease protein
LLRELLMPLAYCLGGFLIFFIAFDLIFDISRFQDKHLLFKDVAEYYVVTLPEILADMVISISLLLACLYALTQLSRHNELTAMRAAGISLWRLALPFLAVGVVCGASVFALDELAVPQAAEKSKAIMERRENPGHDANWTSRLDFQNDAERRHWIIGSFNRVTSEMISPAVSWESIDGSTHRIFAQRAVYTNGEWCFINAVSWDKKVDEIAPLSATNHLFPIKLTETPASIRTEIKINNMTPTEAAKGPQLSIRELLGYLHWHPHLEAGKKASLLTQLQGRMAAPFTCLAVVLIALPFGMRGGRRNVFVGVAGSIFICFAYFILQRISFGLGVGGLISPVVAAWLPNVLFGGIGIVMLSFVR